jgi:hypothetical protein
MSPRPRAAVLVVALLFLVLGGLLATVFFGRFAPAEIVLVRLARPLAAAVLVLLASLACGAGSFGLARAALTRLGGLPRPVDPEPPPALPDCLFVGIPVYGTLLGAVALVASPLETVVAVLTLVLAAFGALVLIRRRPAWTTRLSVRDVLFLGPPVALAILGATTPVASPDELVYKLAIPREYVLHGGMVELPLHSHSYFPAAFGLASLPALVMSGGIAAKLLHLAVYLLTLGVIRRLGDRLDPPAGLSSATVVAWTPAWMLIAGWGWPDWGVVGLLLLSYERWLSFRERDDSGDAALSVLALAGALAARYTALLWLVSFAVAVLFERRRRRAPLGRLLIALAAVLAVFGGFFYLRNLLWTGSPLAPFLLPDSPDLGKFRGEAASGWGTLLHGVDVFHRDIVDDSLGILLPLCVLASPLALRGRGRRFRELFAIALAQLVVFVTIAPLSRLWMTALVPLALLGASAAVRLWRESPRPLSLLLSFGAAVALGGQLVLVGYIFVESYDPSPYVVGRETEEQYRFRTREFARPYAWIARFTPPSSRIFLIGENRTFDLDRPAFAAGNLDGPRLSKYLARFATAKAFAVELRRLGVTHVVTHRPWYRVRGTDPPPSGMLEKEYVVEVGPETDAMLEELFESRAKLRYRDAAYRVYELGRSVSE